MRALGAFHKNKAERGAALVLVLITVSIFLILMGSLIDVLAVESQNAIESEDAQSALTAAYSGVDLMVLSIEEFYQNGVNNGPPPSSVNCAFAKPGGGTVTTSCEAILTKTWSGNGLNYYLIDSTGSAVPSPNQEVDREVLALVKEVPFGAYAHFSETENSNTGGKVWYASGQNFDGPVYSGGPMRIMYTSTDDTPIFPMGFTTVASEPISWRDTVDGDMTKPDTPAEYNSVFGTSSPTLSPNGIPLPGFAQNLAIFSEAYFGDSSHDDSQDLSNAGATKGVFVNGGDENCAKGVLCTGIFVAGSATLSSTSVAGGGDLSSGSQTWTITGDGAPNSFGGTYTITVNFANNTTTVTAPGGGMTTYNGAASGEPNDTDLGNGAIFVDGSLTVNDGSTVHGQYTIAVPDPPVNGESIQLNGSLTYANDPYKNPTQPSQDELALWADTINLVSGDSNPEIEGMILTGYANECTDVHCGGWFANGYCNRNDCKGGGSGPLDLFGSDIENMRGKMGDVDINGNVIDGYKRVSQYDARLGAVPPPFSPTTNLYSIVALSDQGTGQISLSH